jgi:hypothetical protein
LQIPSLFAWRSEAREEIEVRDRAPARPPEAAAAPAGVLEFEFLSRVIAATQSMMFQPSPEQGHSSLRAD